MKIRKPNCGIGLNYSVTDAERFISSLPAEFEILGPGEVAVVWPRELTRDRLEYIASLHNPAGEIDVQLRSLAAIAPDPKKRKVNLWVDDSTRQMRAWDVYSRPGNPWRKVAGPIEIDD